MAELYPASAGERQGRHPSLLAAAGQDEVCLQQSGGRRGRGRVKPGRLIYGGCVGPDSLLAVHLRLLQKRCCVLGAWYSPVHGLNLSGLITDNVRFCPKLR